MLEFYEAYSNYRDLMDLNEQLSRSSPRQLPARQP
jgi:lysyl-tRNA synthetase class II